MGSVQELCGGGFKIHARSLCRVPVGSSITPLRSEQPGQTNGVLGGPPGRPRFQQMDTREQPPQVEMKF